jgi:hypothetical protein
MAHGNAVADRYGVELERNTTGPADSILDNLGNFVEVYVAGDYLAETVGYSDKRPLDVAIVEAARIEQAPVWGSLKALLDGITSHNPDSPYTPAESLET